MLKLFLTLRTPGGNDIGMTSLGTFTLNKEMALRALRATKSRLSLRQRDNQTGTGVGLTLRVAVGGTHTQTGILKSRGNAGANSCK